MKSPRQINKDRAAYIAALSPAERDIISERRRQVRVEGYGPEHDDQHNDFSLSRAASVYALQPHRATIIRDDGRAPINWPWAASSWNPKTPRQDLIRAAALIVAEIERLDRRPKGQADD